MDNHNNIQQKKEELIRFLNDYIQRTKDEKKIEVALSLGKEGLLILEALSEMEINDVFIKREILSVPEDTTPFTVLGLNVSFPNGKSEDLFYHDGRLVYNEYGRIPFEYESGVFFLNPDMDFYEKIVDYASIKFEEDVYNKCLNIICFEETLEQVKAELFETIQQNKIQHFYEFFGENYKEIELITHENKESIYMENVVTNKRRKFYLFPTQFSI